MNKDRRQLMLAMAGLLASSNGLTAELLATPAQTAGPFYPTQPPLDDDNDLTRIRGHSEQASGVISELGGRILDLNGRPLKNLRIEIWQCDINGRYRHPAENGSKPLDLHFQGFGHNISDEQGRYRFRTIRPQPYPGRTPHIHIAVFPAGESPFVTQLYVRGEPLNAIDFLYRSIPVERRQLVEADFRPLQSAHAELAANFDIILDRKDGTPLQG